MTAAEVEEQILGGTQGASVFAAVKGQGSAKLGRAHISYARQFVDRIEIEQAAEVGLRDRLADAVERGIR